MVAKARLLVLTALAFSQATPGAIARDPFEIRLNAGGQEGRRGFDSLERAVDTLGSTAALQGLAPGYSETSDAVATVDLRGLGGTASFPAGSTALTVVIPQAGINQTFTGRTREDSVELFRRWLQGRDNPAIRNLLQAGVRDTAADPMAGNPNSLMNRMVASDFDSAVQDAAGGSTGASLGARFSNFSGGGFNSRTLGLPLGYNTRLSERDSLQFDIPITWSNLDGAESYGGSIGALWRHRITPDWTLQPSFRIGAVGSRDLGAGAGAWSAGLTSTFNFDLTPGTWLTLANSVTYIATIPVTIGKYSLDYDLQNVVFRNGLVLNRDLGFSVLQLAVRGSLFAIDTRFTGDDVYARSYQEFGAFFSFGTEAPARLGFTYLTGSRGVRGFTIGTGVSF